MKRVLVISPHPDDEAIGCGGTLYKHAADGDSVHVIFLTSGENGGHGRSPEVTARLRERESARAREVLGIEQIEFYREPDGGVRIRPQVLARLASKIEEWQPDLVYVPHAGEMHRDHRGALRLTRAALKTLPAPKRPAVLMYEVWTPLKRMDEIVDISRFVPIKRKAIQVYRSQCAVLDFNAAILGLNRYRGEMFCWPEGEYAEVFSRLQVT